MRWSHASLAALMPMSLIISACGGSSDRSDTGSGSSKYAKNGTFTMALFDDPGGPYDPYRTQRFLGLGALAYDSLVNQQPDGRFVSGLAETWKADTHSATFTLKQGITCSDGAPLTSGQVVDAINFVADPKNQSQQYGITTPTVPLTATGDDTARTVTVKLKQPYGFLLNTIGRLPIICARGMKDPKSLATGSAGTGPFVLTKAVPGQSYTFTVRKGYRWGPGGASTDAPGTPSTVLIRIIPNETTAANLLLSGELNLANITGPDRERLAARDLKWRDWKVAGAWLAFNHQSGRSTADVQVRRALVGALDSREVIKLSTGGTGTAATGLTVVEPRGCPGDNVTGMLPRFDPAAAGALLDQAGWTKGADGIRRKGGKKLTVDLDYKPTASAFDKPTAEFMAVRWRAIGVDVKLTANTPARALDVLFKTGDFDGYLLGYGFSLPSQLVPFFSGVVPPHGTNTLGIDNKEYLGLARQAAPLLPAKGCTYWNKAEQALVKNVDIAPMSNRADHWYMRKAELEMQKYNTPVPTSIRMLR